MQKQSSKKQIKNDAMELARIIYDIFAEKELHANITNGQNNTNHKSTD